jgi:4-hydroxy-3-polyprenylbenzoate decarboxylase
MLALAEMGAILLPPVPAFYNRPKDLEDIIQHALARALDRVGVAVEFPEWQGTSRRPQGGPPRG